MASLKYGIQKDMIQMNLLTKLKVIHRLRERTYGCWGESYGWEAWKGHVHTAAFEMDKQGLAWGSSS